MGVGYFDIFGIGFKLDLLCIFMCASSAQGIGKVHIKLSECVESMGLNQFDVIVRSFMFNGLEICNEVN